MRPRPSILLASLAALLAGCGDAPAPLSIDASGAVQGIIFIDQDGNLQHDPGRDTPLPDAAVLLVRGARDTVARAVTGPGGAYRMPEVPVGSYRLVLDSRLLGDSLEVARVDSTSITVRANDSTRVSAVLAFRPLPMAQARSAAPGVRVSVVGVALNAGSAYADFLIHLADGSGPLRLAPARALGVAAGDSVRVRGTMEVRNGRPVLADPAVVALGPGTLPAADSVGTGAAGTADAGRLDAALARVAGAAVLDVSPNPGGGSLILVDDGSGPVEVFVDRTVSGATILPVGSLLAATGVLVPRAGAGGRWQLRPRDAGDLTMTYPAATVAEARASAPGRLVSITGVAVTTLDTFRDGTVHLADGTGTIRAIGVGQRAFLPGDSIRLVGTVQIQNRVPVLGGASVVVLGRGTPVAPVGLTTGVAAGADSGRLDAALVRIGQAVAQDTATVGGGFRLRVNDGSGLVEVFLHPGLAIDLAGFVPGALIDAAGVLVPVGDGRTWRLLPRSTTEVTRR